MQLRPPPVPLPPPPVHTGRQQFTKHRLELEAFARDQSATLIQSSFRCRKARRAVSEKREYKAAVGNMTKKLQRLEKKLELLRERLETAKAVPAKMMDTKLIKSLNAEIADAEKAVEAQRKAMEQRQAQLALERQRLAADQAAFERERQSIEAQMEAALESEEYGRLEELQAQEKVLPRTLEEWQERKREAERAILDEFFAATGGKGLIYGSYWKQTAGWKKGEAAAEGTVGDRFGVTVDGEGFVTAVALPSNGLKGTIPPSFGRLERLRSVDFSGNEGLLKDGPLLTQLKQAGFDAMGGRKVVTASMHPGCVHSAVLGQVKGRTVV